MKLRQKTGIDRLELRHLRYAAEIIREGGFTKAEKKCNAKQPTLGRQMTFLEKRVLGNILLFKRKPFEATKAGRFLEFEARDIIRRTSKLMEDMQQLATGKPVDIRIGYADSPTNSFRNEAFKTFRKETGLRLQHEDLSSIQIINGLRDNDLHVGLTIQLPPKLAARLEFVPLIQFPVCVAVRSNHPITRLRKVTLRDLKGLRFIGFSEADYPEYSIWVRPLLHSIGADLADEFDTAAGLDTAVANDDGVALIASCFAERAGKDVEVVPLEPSPTTVAVGAAYYPDVSLAAKFVSVVRRIVSKRR